MQLNSCMDMPPLLQSMSPSSVALLSSDMCFFHLRDSRQDLQSVQWVHEWKGAADCLQHADGGLSLHAVSSPAPLQLAL